MALRDSPCSPNVQSDQISREDNDSGDVQAIHVSCEQESSVHGQPQNIPTTTMSVAVAAESAQETRNPRGVLKNVTIGQETPCQQENIETAKKSVTMAPETSGQSHHTRTLKRSATIASEMPTEAEHTRILRKSVTIASVTNCLSRDRESGLPFDANGNSRLTMRRNALCDPEKMTMPQEKREMIEKEVDRRKKSLPRRVSNILSKHLNLNIEEDLI